MNSLFLLDLKLFLFFNHLPHNALLDGLALLLSGVGTAGIIWLVLGGVLFFREEKKDHWFALQLGSAGFLAWGLVEQVIKPLISRSRPGLEAGAIIAGGGSDGFSFPSGHAAIAWAMVVLLAQKEPRWRWFFYLLAVAISFSRVYLGKHYPLDVVAGGFLGWGIGFFALRVLDNIRHTTYNGRI
ncbi:phosphatase PAP2 family protein [Candidatus Gottesmanbacteria bacterium]|nr:phosphatase PAP2 family protein [Candidatus Gottesmanbacteria bacterium]